MYKSTVPTMKSTNNPPSTFWIWRKVVCWTLGSYLPSLTCRLPRHFSDDVPFAKVGSVSFSEGKFWHKKTKITSPCVEQKNQCQLSQNFPTYPWNIHRTPNQQFMKEFLSFGGLGISGVCSRGMLGFSLKLALSLETSVNVSWHTWTKSLACGDSARKRLSGWGELLKLKSVPCTPEKSWLEDYVSSQGKLAVKLWGCKRLIKERGFHKKGVHGEWIFRILDAKIYGVLVYKTGQFFLGDFHVGKYTNSF